LEIEKISFVLFLDITHFLYFFSERKKYLKPFDSELSKADLSNRDLVEDQFSRDLDFWELRLQQQWYNLWNRYTMEESDEL